MKDLISIVVPVYNGAASLKELYSQIKAAALKNDFLFELIFVDDGSSDQSYQKIVELHYQDSSVKGIKLAANYGQQNAIFSGLNYVSGDYIITMDDDLQHKPEDIIRLYQKIKEGYDLVYAVSETGDRSLYRQLGSKLRDLIFKLISSKKNDVKVSSFRIMKRQLLPQILAVDKAFIYISAIILKEDLKAANIKTTKAERKRGNSNYNFTKLFKLFFNLYLYYGNFYFLKYFRRRKKQYQIAELIF